MVGHAPADDLACRHVLDSSQVNQRSSVAMYVISASQIVFVFGRSEAEGALEQVGSDAVAVPAVSRDRRPLVNSILKSQWSSDLPRVANTTKGCRTLAKNVVLPRRELLAIVDEHRCDCSLMIDSHGALLRGGCRAYRFLI